MEPFWPFAVYWKMKFSDGRLETYCYTRAWFWENPIRIANAKQNENLESFGGKKANLMIMEKVK